MNKIIFALLFGGSIFCVNQDAFAGKSKPKEEQKRVVAGTSLRGMKVDRLELAKNCLEEAIKDAILQEQAKKANSKKEMTNKLSSDRKEKSMVRRTVFARNNDGTATNWLMNSPLNFNQKNDWESSLED